MRLTLTMIAATALLSGCGEKCEKRFADGQLVSHKLLAMNGIAIKSRDTHNFFDDVCYVEVRWQDGSLRIMSIDELEAAPPARWMLPAGARPETKAEKID